MGNDTNNIYTDAHIHLVHSLILKKKKKKNRARRWKEYSLSHLGSESICWWWQVDLTKCEETVPGIKYVGGVQVVKK